MTKKTRFSTAGFSLDQKPAGSRTFSSVRQLQIACDDQNLSFALGHIKVNDAVLRKFGVAAYNRIEAATNFDETAAAPIRRPEFLT